MQTTQDIPSLKSFAELQQAHTDEFIKMAEAIKDSLQTRYPEKDFYGPVEIIEDMKSAILSAGRLIDIVKRNKELEAEVERLKAELAKHTTEKHPYDYGLVAVRYNDGGHEIAAWTPTPCYREFISHFQNQGYLVKPAREVEVRDDRKDYFVKNAWKP